MNFEQFLNEALNKTQFEKVTPEQLAIIKREIDRNSIRVNFEKDYIEKDKDIVMKLVDSTFYAAGLALDEKENVLVKCIAIVEITEDDGYVYYKPVEFVFAMDTGELSDIKDVDRTRDENWKVVQDSISRYASKI